MAGASRVVECVANHANAFARPLADPIILAEVDRREIRTIGQLLFDGENVAFFDADQEGNSIVDEPTDDRSDAEVPITKQ